MKNTRRALKVRYIVFIGSIILLIVATQAVVQYDLDQQTEDARLINIAGRQRMLSQRISKLTLYLRESTSKLNSPDPKYHSIDTLRKIVDEWQSVHSMLLRRSEQGKNTTKIDSLLRQNSKYLDPIVASCRAIIDHPDSVTVNRASREISQAEIQFLLTMDKTVHQYQVEAENKLYTLKRIELILAGVALLVLLLEFLLFFLPILNKLRSNNIKLSKVNRQLQQSNNDLAASEEEIRTHLDQISALQSHLASQEKQFRELVETATDLIYELNETGTFSFVNPVLISISGYTKDELLSMKYWDLVHPDHRNEVVKFYNDQRERKEETSFHRFPILTRLGQTIWIDQNVRLFFSGDWIYKVSVVARDVSKLREAEFKLSESEKLFRMLAENAPVGIFQMNAESKCVYVNKRWTKLSGYSEEETFASNWLVMIHPEEREAVTKAWVSARDADREFVYEFRLQHPDGAEVWVDARATALRNDKGELTGHLGIVVDITALKSAQQKLAESERLYRLLATNSKDLITLYKPDQEATRVFISPSVKEILGYTQEELVGKSPFEIIVEDDAAKMRTETHPTTLSGRPAAVEYRIRKKDGTIIWMESNSHPFFDADGRMIGFQTSARDITQRKQFERELILAKEKAEEATKIKSQFLSMMSHEVRTPMNAIIGLSNLLIEDSPRPEQLESLELLKFSGHNLLTILNDILDFSKIEANKINIELADFDLHDTLDNIVRMHQPKAKEKSITLSLQYDKSLPDIVVADSVRLSQVINNLLTNAIKFTESGSIHLAVNNVTRSRLNGQSPVEFEFIVRDTGIGIPEDKLDTIFESFSQAASDTTRRFGGTGLGLTITKRLIQLMGSDIRVESKLGQGSEFRFTLRLHKGNAANIRRATEHNAKAFKGRKINILLVEDNRVNQVVATNFLRRWGIEYSIANNGLEAVELVKLKRFDLVLMDLQMPEMDGYQATARIRQMDDDYYRNLPIIALTASAMNSMRDKVLSHGMTDFLSKPFQPEDLQKIILLYTAPGENELLSRSVLADNLDLYTESNNQFKLELIGHLLKNIQELKNALETALDKKRPEVFQTVSHKCKTTLSMLGDKELLDVVEEVKKQLQAVSGGASFDSTLLRRFQRLADETVSGLQEEAAGIKA